jgi:flagellar biosynthesis regulator FlaF
MESNEFIDSLKRDKARGNLAPHQIVLLLTLLNLHKENNSSILNIFSLNNEFQKVWNAYKNDFKTTNNKLGMPLKAFVNKGYVTIEISEEINDFRNLLELESKISKLEIADVLLTFLKIDKIEGYLISRITK